MRIGFCVFDLSTKELHHGKESQEGETEEEKIILSFGINGASHLSMRRSSSAAGHPGRLFRAAPLPFLCG
jgi:hypothetical protein